MSHGDGRFAVGGKGGPVSGDRLVVIDQPALCQNMDNGREDALGHGEDGEQRVAVDKAAAAHDSAGYQAALKALGDGAERDIRILEGV